jgi:putative addiction module antidote
VLRKREFEARLVKQGNSTGLTLTREVLEAAGLERDDRVIVTASKDGLTVRKAEGEHQKWMEAYRKIADRYRHTFAALAK